jgi:hypothetical protein
MVFLVTIGTSKELKNNFLSSTRPNADFKYIKQQLVLALDRSVLIYNDRRLQY